MSVVIRPRKDGGYSECSSPDELVGHGRCCHVLDHDKPIMEIEKIQRGAYEVKVSDSTLTINAQKNAIIDFFNSMEKIDSEKKKDIIDFLNEE